MSTFDLKSFMINEGMTRVSRDRKRLLKENLLKEDSTDFIAQLFVYSQKIPHFARLETYTDIEDWANEVETVEIDGKTVHGAENILKYFTPRKTYLVLNDQDPYFLATELGVDEDKLLRKIAELGPISVTMDPEETYDYEDTDETYDYIELPDFVFSGQFADKAFGSKYLHEGMTRVSRDRKRLNEGYSTPVIPKGQEREGWDDAAEQAMTMLDGIDSVDTDMYQDVILNTDRSIEDLNGDLEGTTCCVVRGYDGRPVFFDLSEDNDYEWLELVAQSEEDIKNIARKLRNASDKITADLISMAEDPSEIEGELGERL